MAKLAVIKTQENEDSVSAFLDTLNSEQQRSDSRQLVQLMQKITKEQPRMWGKNMIGFGRKVYTSPASGRQVEWFLLGFSPRKANLSLHLMNLPQEGLEKLGKHKTGMGCLYLNKLDDVDLKVLETILRTAFKANQ